jgi:DNA-binding transcriptional LysR family regulator
MRNCLQSGVGVTLCPAVSVRKELSERRLIKIPWVDDPLETTILMIWHAEKWCSPLLKLFMQIAEAEIRRQE